MKFTAEFAEAAEIFIRNSALSANSAVEKVGRCKHKKPKKSLN